jgi:uncharacterized SAM-binding protein YcdF (DUF218 family)
MSREGKYIRKFTPWVSPIIIGCLTVFGVTMFLNAARWLVLDLPEHSDVILILDGSFPGRFEKGVSLVQAGYGNKIILTENADKLVYGRTRADLASEFIRNSGQAFGGEIAVCPTNGNSIEAIHHIARCLAKVDTGTILLVTSDYDTRRTFSMFTKLLPRYHWSISAAKEPSVFGYKWWTRREWARQMVTQWEKLLWWYGAERWLSW